MLAILTTHPIQYQAPVWRELARRAGVPFEVWFLSDQGARHGIDAEFGRDFAWDIDLLNGYPHRFLPTHPSRADVRTFRGARVGSPARLLRERGVTVLWINGWQVQAYWQAAFAASNMGVRVWLRGETNDLAVRSRIRTLARSIALRLLFRRVSRFLYVGSANRREYERFGVPRERLVATPYCVDNGRFWKSAQAARTKREGLREKWGIPANALCFLYAGKLIAKKRPHDVIEALSAVLRRSPELVNRVHLLVVGDGALMNPLQTGAAQLATECGRSLVSFAGFLNQTEIPRAYAAADCLVLPSDSRETWGLVTNEALASGIPAIVSDRCGCAEDLIAPLDPRLIFPCGGVEALAHLIEETASGRLPLPGSEQCRSAVADYDISATIDAIVREYVSRS